MPATPAADTPVRRTGIRRTLERAAATAACLVCGMLALPALASATLDANSTPMGAAGVARRRSGHRRVHDPEQR
ncbi:MAG TPA: hypothetical protein VME22_13415 [Solirubrobacteraceae bacterium]|nr:hypothetical protein [Solirubrobacteraceae bacterium]